MACKSSRSSARSIPGATASAGRRAARRVARRGRWYKGFMYSTFARRKRPYASGESSSVLWETIGEPIRSRIVRSCLFSSSLGSRAVRNNGCILPARWKSLLLRAWM